MASEYIQDTRPGGTGYWYPNPEDTSSAPLREGVSPKGNLVLICTGCNKTAYPRETDAVAAELRTGGTRYYNKTCRNWHVRSGGGQGQPERPSSALASEAITEVSKVDSPAPAPRTNGKIKLRDYQEAAHHSIYEYFEANDGNPIVAMPTGTGKSLVVGEFIRTACLQYHGTRILVLTHVKELIEQNYRTLLKMWPTASAGVFSAGLGRKEWTAPILFAGIQSIHRCAEQFEGFDLILVDECHLVPPKAEAMYGKVLSCFRGKRPHLKVVGFSATPYRLKQGMLTDGGLFTDVCFDLTSRDAFNWLIAQGWLVKPVPRRTHERLDVSNVRMVGGEFVAEELQKKVDVDTVTMAALQEAVTLAGDRKHWLVFASGIDHAEHIADFLDTQFGITAAAVHSRMPDSDRDRAIQDFRTGRIQAIVNNNILTTGFDYPDIDCIVMLRPTASPVLWVQMVGRGTRPIYAEGLPLGTPEERLAAIAASVKPDCLVLDFARNTERLGPINDPIIPHRKKRTAPGIAPIRCCDFCNNYSHASCRNCEHCGHEFPRTIKFDTSSSLQQLLAGTVPEVHTYNVDRVVYHKHSKPGKPDSMRVDYWCGMRRISEWVGLDHVGYTRRKAELWWRMRCPWGVPPNVDAGMTAIKFLKVPKAITVLEKGKYPEITGFEFVD